MSDNYENTHDRVGAYANMIDDVLDGKEKRKCDFKEPVCIHTDQVYDSCRERSCIRDTRVYFPKRAQHFIDESINVKVKRAEIIWVYSTVEPVPFNRGFFTVDIKYFVKVKVEAFKGLHPPMELEGLATFDKKVILFGSEGRAKIFQSNYNPEAQIPKIWRKNNLPKAIVEVVDPIALSAKLLNPEECCCCDCHDHFLAIPDSICECFDDELVIDDDVKKVLVTLGLFTIVKIERNVQILINAIDFCVPEKECKPAEDNPCSLFDKMKFPLDEFFPPLKTENQGSCGCQCEYK